MRLNRETRWGGFGYVTWMGVATCLGIMVLAGALWRLAPELRSTGGKRAAQRVRWQDPSPLDVAAAGSERGGGGSAMSAVWRVAVDVEFLALATLGAVVYLGWQARRDRRRWVEQLREQDGFLAVASHELRSPLTVIRLQTQAILRSLDGRSCDGERLGRRITAIERQTTHMTRLVHELLDLGRIDGGGLELVRQPIDLVGLAREVVAQLQATCSHHRLRLECEAAEIVLSLDGARIEQVLWNLLHNAVKYSPDGGEVEVRLALTDSEAITSVRDEGMGIPVDEQERLFARFYRARNARADKILGLGVGLYISRQIVSCHGGRMWFESAVGQGSTFYFSLPLDAAPRDGSTILARS